MGFATIHSRGVFEGGGGWGGYPAAASQQNPENQQQLENSKLGAKSRWGLLMVKTCWSLRGPFWDSLGPRNPRNRKCQSQEVAKFNQRQEGYLYTRRGEGEKAEGLDKNELGKQESHGNDRKRLVFCVFSFGGGGG